MDWAQERRRGLQRLTDVAQHFGEEYFGQVKRAQATANTTLTTTAQSITGDGDSSKVRLLLPTTGDWVVIGVVDFDLATVGAQPLVGELFVDDSGTAEASQIISQPTTVHRATTGQVWNVTVKKPNTPIEIKVRKGAAGGAAGTFYPHTTLTAFTGVGGGYVGTISGSVSGAPATARYFTLFGDAALSNEVIIGEASASTIDAGIDLLFQWAEGNQRDFQIQNLTAGGSAVYKAFSATGGSPVVLEGYVGVDVNPFVQLLRTGLKTGPGGASVLDTSFLRSAAGVWTATGSIILSGGPLANQARLLVQGFRNTGAGSVSGIQFNVGSQGLQTAAAIGRRGFEFVGVYDLGGFTLTDFLGGNFVPSIQDGALDAVARLSNYSGAAAGADYRGVGIINQGAAFRIRALTTLDSLAGFVIPEHAGIYFENQGYTKGANIDNITATYGWDMVAQVGDAARSFRVQGSAVSRHVPRITFGADADPATSAAIDLQSTTAALLLNRLTTTQRDALTAVDGMEQYNASDKRQQARENGKWRSLSADIGEYDPGSVTVATEQYMLQFEHLKLTGTERLTLEGTARINIDDFDNYEDPTIYVGYPRMVQDQSVTLRDGYNWDIDEELRLLGAARATLVGTSRVVISDNFKTRNRIVLAGGPS